MTLPRLHAITNDDVLRASDFRERATALVRALGPSVALHIRGRGPVDLLLNAAEMLREPTRDFGCPLLVNARVDVALAAEADGVQLGERSVPLQAALKVLGGEALIGYSAHGASEAASAFKGGAGFVLLGTIWETASHPGKAGAGLERVRETVAVAEGPVLAIGGVTPERAADAVAAGAWGVAAIRGIWEADDPVRSARDYLYGMGVENP